MQSDHLGVIDIGHEDKRLCHGSCHTTDQLGIVFNGLYERISRVGKTYLWNWIRAEVAEIVPLKLEGRKDRVPQHQCLDTSFDKCVHSRQPRTSSQILH